MAPTRNNMQRTDSMRFQGTGPRKQCQGWCQGRLGAGTYRQLSSKCLTTKWALS